MASVFSSLGQVTAVIGAQWGDEGKGKIVDILAQHFDVIARANGGANAGHTIVIGKHKHVYHLLPSGCFHEGKPVILGSGMVIHLPTLLQEIATLEEHGISIVDRLFISHEAHIVFDYHKQVDGALEERRIETKGQELGTTRRGIGPAYMDKACRIGIRMGAMGTDIRGELEARKTRVKSMYGVDIDTTKEAEQLAKAHDRIGSCIVDTVGLLHQMQEERKSILIEGAQATLLDIDHGTYPFVTSSSTTSAGALQGLGIPPNALKSCIGVAKAYCTRVGGGPFLSEAKPAQAERLRERGGEYGTTTGRPRRCGWLSIPDLQRSLQMNGFTHWNITKLDVLDQEEEIPVCVGIEQDTKPVWEALPGWKESTAGIKEFQKLPENAQAYISFIEKKTSIPVAFIGTGQEREEMIVRS